MFRAKLLAMCICPAVLAPPTILAVHRPARHAVAHLLQRVAHRLDDRVPTEAAPPAAQYANIPCAPTLADTSGSAVPVIDGIGLATIPPADQVAFGDATRPGGGYFIGGGAPGGGGVPGSGSSGGGGGGFGGLPGLTPSSGGASGSVPEPATWGMFVAGFGVIGAGLRSRQATSA